uniref:DNA repair protein rad5 n=1 Tax=Colletotrichum fructicola (strain Nara gc5) TaxID=1213859 RepID=L2GAP1_COLFN
MHRSFDAAFKTQESAEYLLAGEVCFGALLDGAALPTKPVEDCFYDEGGGCEGFVTCSVQQIDGYHVLYAMGCSDEYALLDVSSSNRLHVIESIETIRYEAMVETAMVNKRRKRPNSKSAPISLSINIFGQPSVAMEAGRRLSAASIFLQHPKALHKGIEYRNPQFLIFPEDTADMRAFVGVTNDSPSTRRAMISDEISNILNCLSDDLSGMTMESTEHYGLLSVLKPETLSTPNQHGGGIIADAMGLGKTLTVLTAILQSSHKAALFRDFVSIPNISQEPKVRTGATLVVVSSAQLLESWGSEIQRHVLRECLNTIVFHGQSRPHDSKSLLKTNIVLTTYGTLVAEEKGRKVLQQLNWFRIVLDEGEFLDPPQYTQKHQQVVAHWIRNTNSRQFKSAVKLSAKNRWCLTGTPIQNRLEDIAALAGFLQLHPFPTKISFQKSVLDPLSQGGRNFSEPLRSWLRAVCIRRTGKLLQLPDTAEETILVSLSLAERILYDQVLHRTKREIDDTVSKGKTIKKYNFLFTAILKMRMLCNSGTYSNYSGSHRYLRVDSQVKYTGCEQCAASKDEDATLLLAAFQFCPDCGRSLQISSPGSNPESSRDGNSPLPEFYPTPEERFTPSDVYSAKLFAVTNKIRACRSTSKHIVFSYWTSTLDLLSNLLGNEAVTHVQVDGRTSYAERTNRLQSFREDNDICALLMSIETGALGLNLTAANYVHIVEPQWNPSIEEQAIGRALRIGQTREVTVVRYIVQGTVEQNIMQLQKKKKSAAKFMFNLGTSEELDEKLEDLKFVLDLDPAIIQ